MTRLKFRHSVIGALALIATTSPALADASDDAKAALEPRYAALQQAMEAQDGPATKALLTKDFQSADISGGTANANEFVEDLTRYKSVGGRPNGGPGGGRRGDGPPPPGAPGAGGPPSAGPPSGPASGPGFAGGPKPERKITGSFVSFTVKGDLATGIRKHDITGSRIGQDGATHSFEMIQLSDDIWQLQGGVWLLKSTIAKEMTMMRDGQQMRHMVAGQGGQ